MYVNQRSEDCSLQIICDIFIGTLVRREKTGRYSIRKVIESGVLMTDMPICVFCKFEMCSFKITLVINENTFCVSFCTEYIKGDIYTYDIKRLSFKRL